MDFPLPLDSQLSLRHIKFCNECFILIAVFEILNADDTLKELGEKRQLYLIKRISHTLSAVFGTVTSNVCVREGIKTTKAYNDTVQLPGKARHVAIFPLDSPLY